MSLQTKLEADLKTAMLARQEVTRDTLRLLISEMKRKQVELLKDTLTPDEELSVVQKAQKMRHESIETFDKNNRKDLADKERAELSVIQIYLPKLMSEDETRAAVKGVLAELGITAKKDMGAVMKPVMAKYKGQVDGKLVQRILGELLS
jgi:uncharacterized protein YqeY